MRTLRVRQRLLVAALLGLALILPSLKSFAETPEQAYEKLKSQYSKNSAIYVRNWHEKNGLPSGVVEGYYTMGLFQNKKAVEMNFADGVQDGLTRFYTLDGIVSKEITYEKGIPISTKLYDETGQVTSSETMDPYLRKAYLLQQSGKHDEAMDVYKDCSASDSTAAFSCGLLLISDYKNTGDKDKAVRLIDNLISKYSGQEDKKAVIANLQKMREDLSK
jgi:tetratricopeptide (TPR) repeat protein